MCVRARAREGVAGMGLCGSHPAEACCPRCPGGPTEMATLEARLTQCHQLRQYPRDRVYQRPDPRPAQVRDDHPHPGLGGGEAGPGGAAARGTGAVPGAQGDGGAARVIFQGRREQERVPGLYRVGVPELHVEQGHGDRGAAGIALGSPCVACVRVRVPCVRSAAHRRR